MADAAREEERRKRREEREKKRLEEEAEYEAERKRRDAERSERRRKRFLGDGKQNELILFFHFLICSDLIFDFFIDVFEK